MSMKRTEINALIRLKACRSRLTKQQYKTLRGQILAGDYIGAMKGLQNLLAQAGTNYEEEKDNGKLDFQ